MKKGIIKGISNQEKIVWYRLKPALTTINLIDEIITDINKYDSGEVFDPEGPKLKSYKKFVRRRSSYFDRKRKLYAIGIYNEDLVDFIIFKDNPHFSRIQKLMNEKFDFIIPAKPSKKHKK